jgi:hypothetical protein
MCRSKLRYLLVASLLLFTTLAVAQRGALTSPANLPQLEDRAAVILHGYVESATIQPHPEYQNLATVVVRIRIREVWKGNAPGQSYTFRQYIWDLRDRLDAAGYRKGQELVLFLNPTTPKGLTSPVGLEQGRFQVMRGRDGRIQVVNGRGNSGLLRGAEPRLRAGQAASRTTAIALSHGGGPLDLEDFRSMVSAIERSAKGGQKR